MRQVGDLVRRLGEGPALREVRRRLEAGVLLGAADASGLALRAEDDRRSRADQERLHADYLTWRAAEARRLAKG